jgi:sigma-B regulation protein RsbU (phosphoserine phosphatase)
MIGEVLVSLPDGKTKTIRLDKDRWSVGRSSDNDFGYPEDSGLSRQHLIFERDGDIWTVRDLASKNGTYVNNVRVQAPQPIAAGDRITASQLTFLFEPATKDIPQVSIIFDKPKSATASTQTLSTSLGHLMSSQTFVDKPTQGRVSEQWKTPFTAFLRAGRELSLGRPLPELFRVILDLSIEAVGAERGVLLTLEGDRLVAQASRGDDFRISSTVRDRVLNERTSLIIRNVQDEEAFRAMHSIVSQGVRTLMAVPLQTDERVIGLIYVDTSHWLREFNSDDLNLLTAMANVAAIRIERERLAELEHSRRRLASELEQAAEIQKQFLPNRVPVVRGLELAGFNASCRTVGGDYYDFVTRPEDSRIAVMVGDVCGKGMPAALLMMSLQARVQVLTEDAGSPARLMERLNRILTATSLNQRFVSLFFSEVTPETGEMVYCNAGHNPPLLIRSSGQIEWIDGGGPVLGILPDIGYEECQCCLQPGDVMVLFSDGVTEATNSTREEFGEARLAALAQQVRHQSAESILNNLREAVQDWIAGSPAADDITLVIVRKTVLS